MQVIKKLLIISDSMLRFQGKAGSRLGSGHFCSVHAFGGALCSEITGNILDICEKTTKGYYDRVIVMAGTNNMSKQGVSGLYVYREMIKLLTALAKLGGTIILIGLLPRGFCQCSKSEKCRNIHKSSKKKNSVMPWEVNKEACRVNDCLFDSITHDVRFSDRFHFVDLFKFVLKQGSYHDNYDGVLRYDGLHLSIKGNEILDRKLGELFENMK